MFPGLQDISGAPTFTGGSASSPQTTSAGFNNSGWTVNTGNGSAAASPVAGNQWLIMGGLALVALMVWKTRK